MGWNLVDEFASLVSGDPRPFVLPLAAIPPGSTTVRSVASTQFECAMDTTNRDDPYLRIRISPPANQSFTNEGTLPDPAMRLHAMVDGIVRFAPASDGLSDRLILKMPLFSSRIAALWWRQWRIYPTELIYENVDTFRLEQMLFTSTLPGRLLVPGLELPADADPASKADFLAKFFVGTPGYTLTASAGAVLGQADDSPGDAQKKELRFHVRYGHHSAAAPRPMHPREFFCLLFGNDSPEFTEGATAGAHTGHSLLLSMQATGEGVTNVMPTKTLRLRPPLFTFKRVLWEAAQEMGTSAASWKPGQPLGEMHLFNTFDWRAGRFNRGDYTVPPKCNLLVFDICLRAGFRTAVHQTGEGPWHYLNALSACNRVHEGFGIHGSEPVSGVGPNGNVVWARNIERWLVSPPSNVTSVRFVNEGIEDTGRCFVLAGSKGSKRPGHMVIVRKLNAAPSIPQSGGGVASANVNIIEAGSTNGASDSSGVFCTGGNSAAADGRTGFTRIQIYEAEPGGDPGTVWGIADLNAECRVEA